MVDTHDLTGGSRYPRFKRLSNLCGHQSIICFPSLKCCPTWLTREAQSLEMRSQNPQWSLGSLRGIGLGGHRHDSIVPAIVEVSPTLCAILRCLYQMVFSLKGPVFGGPVETIRVIMGFQMFRCWTTAKIVWTNCWQKFDFITIAYPCIQVRMNSSLMPIPVVFLAECFAASKRTSKGTMVILIVFQACGDRILRFWARHWRRAQLRAAREGKLCYSCL